MGLTMSPKVAPRRVLSQGERPWLSRLRLHGLARAERPDYFGPLQLTESGCAIF
jgi:hypothetical protein